MDKQPMQPTKRSALCLSAYRLDQYFLGTQAHEEHNQSAKHLQSCPRCQEALRRLEEEAAQATALIAKKRLLDEPTALIAKKRLLDEPKAERDEKKRQSAKEDSIFSLLFSLFLRWRVGLAAFACAILAVFGWSQLRRVGKTTEYGRYATIRGEEASLRVIRKRGALVEMTHSGDAFRAGDLLRLVVRWKRGCYLWIVHRSAKGGYTPLYPSKKTAQSLLLPTEEAVELEGSLEVEGEAQGNEEIIACFSTKPLSFELATKAIQSANEKNANFVVQEKQSVCEIIQRFVLSR
jgi:hypothetical protein